MERISNEQCTSTWYEAHCSDNLSDQSGSILLHGDNFLKLRNRSMLFFIGDVRRIKFR